MTNAFTKYLNALEDIRLVQRRIISKADAFREVHFNDLADDLEKLADNLDAAVDRLMENSEAENPQGWAEAERRLDNILSPMLEKCIEDDERARQ